MKLAYICSRYADPDPALRRRNLAEARALARWAEAQGYACVTWWGSLDPDDPPCDSDEAVRAQALARSAALAATVGDAGGDIIAPEWYDKTAGMIADYRAWHHCPGSRDVRLVSWSEVEPYYRAPVDTVPRAKVQAAFDEYWEKYGELHVACCGGNIKTFAREIWASAAENIEKKIQAAVNNIDTLRALCVGDPAYAAESPGAALQDALDIINEKTGVTPTEVAP